MNCRLALSHTGMYLITRASGKGWGADFSSCEGHIERLCESWAAKKGNAKGPRDNPRPFCMQPVLLLIGVEWSLLPLLKRP
jgi:hypothetical protein